MGLLKNFKEIVIKRLLPNTPITNQEVGISQINYSGAQDPNEKEAVFPAWFFSSRLGQPRQVDTNKMRELAQSAWVQMVISTFKKQIYNTEWDIINEDEKDETDRTTDIKKVKDFLMKINTNQQTIDDVNSEMITDIAEIDAGCANLVYSANSYTLGDIDIFDARGKVIGSEFNLILNPLGQRELVAIKSVDGSSMLKQVNLYKNLINYWQYSFKHPRQNPTRFEKDEIAYCFMNNKSYSVYGFSPVQAIQQVLELLIQGTRYNKDLYTNNAIPDIMISLPKLAPEKLKKLKRKWNNQYKGKPHQVGFVNWAFDKIHKLTENNRDLEWLGGQQWYKKIVFGVFGVSPEEAGFTESSNRATGDSQERVTVRNAVKPYMKKFEQLATRRYITEILQREDHGLKFVYKPKDHTLEKIEFEQDMLELDHNTMSINEFRRKKGRDPIDGGDDPFNNPAKQMNPFGGFGETGDNNPKDPKKPNPKLEDLNEDQKKILHNQLYKKGFERFLDDSKSRTNK